MSLTFVWCMVHKNLVFLLAKVESLNLCDWFTNTIAPFSGKRSNWFCILFREWSEPRRLLDMSAVHNPSISPLNAEKQPSRFSTYYLTFLLATFQIFNLLPNINVFHKFRGNDFYNLFIIIKLSSCDTCILVNTTECVRAHTQTYK